MGGEEGKDQWSEGDKRESEGGREEGSRGGMVLLFQQRKGEGQLLLITARFKFPFAVSYV